MTHAAQAWMALTVQARADGVRVLEDGLTGFAATVLMPDSLRDPAAPARSPEDAVRYHELRRLVEGAEEAPAGPFASEPLRLEAPGVVTTAWLARHYGRVVVLDGRGKAEDYAAGHLPGAWHLPVGALRENRGGVVAVDDLRAPEELARIYSQFGIDPETEVVAYADARMHDAAHALMGLFRLGHHRVAILDGGVERWRAEGRPLVAGEPPAPVAAPAPYPLDRADASFVAELAAVVSAQRDGNALILDVRPADQFRGETSTEARVSHVPGAVNRPVALDQDGAAWRPEAELRAAYDALGVRPGAEVIVGCRTGHQAALTWFTLRWLLGIEDAKWWDGSWQEWV
jgi:thiosulfate/3-mercaptopyruvate sulfurtransferase